MTSDRYFLYDDNAAYVHTYPGKGNKTAGAPYNFSSCDSLFPMFCVRLTPGSPLTGENGIARTIEGKGLKLLVWYESGS